MRSPLGLVSAVCLAAFSLAPVSAQARLVALVNDPLTLPASEVVLSEPGGCGVTDRCFPAGFPPAVNPLAGGTAHDPRTGGTWITNGNVIARVDPDTCQAQCTPIAVPLPFGAFFTGLAFYEQEDTLLLIDSAGGLTTVQVSIDCAFGAIQRCVIQTPQPLTQSFAGLAVDEVRGLVFYSSMPSILPVLTQTIFVARFADPCTPFCSVELQPCPTLPVPVGLGPITGLAFDPCERRIIATDGRNLVSAEFAVVGPGQCTLGVSQCCNPQPPLDQIRGAIGLCLRPAGGTVVGTSCANGSCAPCSNMTLELIGDPSIGNSDFGIALRNAPLGALAFLGVNSGPCQLPGVSAPPLCGPINLPFAPAAPLFVGPMLTTQIGAMPCQGRANFGVSIPLDPGLCGDVFSFQGIVICNSAQPAGTAITACTEVVISGT